MNRTQIISRIAAAALSVGIVTTGASTFAADTSTVTTTWFTAMQQVVAEKLPASVPVTVSFGGESFPVFVKALPKYTITITAGPGDTVMASAGPIGRALR